MLVSQLTPFDLVGDLWPFLGQGDDVLMMLGTPRVEVCTGSQRRRRWSPDQKTASATASLEANVGEASLRIESAALQLA